MQLLKNLKKMISNTDDEERKTELKEAILKIKNAKKSLFAKRRSEHEIIKKIAHTERRKEARRGFGKNYFTEKEIEKRSEK